MKVLGRKKLKISVTLTVILFHKDHANCQINP